MDNEQQHEKIKSLIAGSISTDYNIPHVRNNTPMV